MVVIMHDTVPRDDDNCSTRNGPPYYVVSYYSLSSTSYSLTICCCCFYCSASLLAHPLLVDGVLHCDYYVSCLRFLLFFSVVCWSRRQWKYDAYHYYYLLHQVHVTLSQSWRNIYRACHPTTTNTNGIHKKQPRSLFPARGVDGEDVTTLMTLLAASSN